MFRKMTFEKFQGALRDRPLASSSELVHLLGEPSEEFDFANLRDREILTNRPKHAFYIVDTTFNGWVVLWEPGSILPKDM